MTVRAALALWLAAAGCQGRAPAPAASVGVAADDATVVATVDGRPIRVSDVALQAHAAAASPRAALEQLIDAELVAAEAERRGVAADPDVRTAVAQAMVRRYLANGFEREVDSSTVSEAEMRRAYQRSRARLDHGPLVEVRHIVALTAGSDGPRRAELRARMQSVAARAKRAASPEAFSALAAELSDAAVKLKAETLITDRDTVTVRPFADAAFGLPSVGATSEVVETSFGYHVLYLVRRLPEEHIGYDEALPKLREALWPAVRRREFDRRVDALVERHRIELHPELLGEGGS